jgi:hypothetical protein
MKCYNIALKEDLEDSLFFMPHAHEHHHHHHVGNVHPPAALAPSLLRSSVGQRLALAAGVAAALWLCVLWAIG